MTKPVLLAGLLGGLLGAVGSFVLARSFPAAVKPVAAAEAPKSEARERADDLVAKLRAGQEDDFFKTLRAGFVDPVTDEDFQKYREELSKMRQGFAEKYGAPFEFEFGSEVALSPSLVRVSYVARYARRCVGCLVMFYHAADGWRILGFRYVPLEEAFKELR